MFALHNYLETNELIINLKKGKTECMLFGTAKRIATLPKVRELKIYYNGTLINSTTSYKYLGTLLDQNMSLNADFDQKYKNSSSKLGLLRKLMPLLTLEAGKLLYSSAIVPVFRFNCITNLNLNQGRGVLSQCTNPVPFLCTILLLDFD